MSNRKRGWLFAAIGGGIATGVDVSVLASLVNSGAPIAVAAFLGALAGAGFGFVINKYLAFRDHRPLSMGQLGSYGLVSGSTAMLMAAAMYVMCDRGDVPYLLGKLICATAVFALWSYPAQRRLVFVASH